MSAPEPAASASAHSVPGVPAQATPSGGSSAVPPAAGPGETSVSHSHTKSSLMTLTLGALGVVFGDIGTSPLYAVQTCFAMKDGKVEPHAVPVAGDTVLGVLSLVFWSLTVVVAVKYIGFIMRADNKGEGGIFALLALVPHDISRRTRIAVTMAALFGAALLYGDGVITPAISVLSAIEGLKVATSAADPFVVPLTLIVLLLLFLVQRRGTGGIGKVFGPVMIVWFIAIASLGGYWIVQNPDVLKALNPLFAVAFFAQHQFHGFVVLGSVVLCITGGEALYADMGHFGPSAIRRAWFFLVFPALLLNYFGQGAYLLQRGWTDNPFYALVPHQLLYPMVALATAATVIASQALISGAFSLTRQAVQMGYFPRVTVVHTSARDFGQIYVPEVNQALAVACVLLVLAFKESGALAAAYGIAVTGTMGITSVVYFYVITHRWKWPVPRALALVALFMTFDIAFFGANLLKFKDGGWFPIAVAAGIFVLMTTWKRGRMILAERFKQTVIPVDNLLSDLEVNPPHRVRGTAVFMAANTEGTPPVLLHHLKHNQVLHRQVVLMSIVSADQPVVPKAERLEVKSLGNGFFRLLVRSGFMETPNVPELLLQARSLGLVCEPSTTSFYLGRETLLTGGTSGMPKWRKAIFSFVSRNALSATNYFGLPPNRVVELGMQVDL
ncbi:MAG: potassium transporter Kup [Myxococcaceae bacterium]